MLRVRGVPTQLEHRVNARDAAAFSGTVPVHGTAELPRRHRRGAGRFDSCRHVHQPRDTLCPCPRETLHKRWTFVHLNPYSPTTCEKKLAKFSPSYGRIYVSAHMPCLDSDPQPIEISSFPPHSRYSLSRYGRVPRSRDLCTVQVSFPFFYMFL